MLSSQSDESNKDEKPKDKPVNSKICPICNEKLEAKTDKELSQKLADHIQENHPEPIKKPEPIQDTELPNKKKTQVFDGVSPLRGNSGNRFRTKNKRAHASAYFIT